MMTGLKADLRYAMRSFRRAPGFTAVAVLTLGLGIGANTAIFSVVNAVVFRPLPFADPGALVAVGTLREGAEPRPGVVSAPNFMSIREENRTFASVAAYHTERATLREGGPPVEVEAARVSADFFALLGRPPQHGRAFLEEENRPGNNDAVVLSHELWQQRFGASPEVVGSTVTIDGRGHVVTGVAPPGFSFPDRRALWRPLAYGPAFDSRTAAGRDAVFLKLVARLRPDAALREADADLREIAWRLAEEHPSTNEGVTAIALPLQRMVVGEARTPLLILTGAVGLILLIACVNVSNLLLARDTAREGEFAVRSSLGGSRWQLGRQLLVENMVLGLAGGGVGLLLAEACRRTLVASGPEGVARLEDIRVDAPVVLFTVGASVLTTVLFGLLPAFRILRADARIGVGGGERGATSGRGRRRLQGGLVVAEVALAVVLLTGAGLLLRSFAHLHRVNPGYRPENVAAFDLSLPRTDYSERSQVDAFYRSAFERLEALPAVRSVGGGLGLPLTGFGLVTTFRIEGDPPQASGENSTLHVRMAAPGYFRTLGIPVKRGRDFADHDRSGSTPVVVVNEAAVDRYFRGREPVGRRVWLDWVVDSVPMGGEVVGVVGNTRQFELSREPEPEVYLAHAQVPPLSSMTVVFRTDGDPTALFGAVRREVGALDPNLPVSELRPLMRDMEASVHQPRFYAMLLGLFAAIALALAAVGVFGVVSHGVERRTREIGIRMAVGATPRDVMRLIAGQAAVPVVLGLLLGAAGALALTGFLRSLLYQVGPADPATFAGAVLLLGGTGVLAILIPARRAASLDSMAALRHE